MKLGIIPFHSAQRAVDVDVDSKFLINFTSQSLLGAFTCLNLPPRKFPSIFHVAISTLCSEHTPLLVDNHCCHHFNLFHSC